MVGGGRILTPSSAGGDADGEAVVAGGPDAGSPSPDLSEEQRAVVDIALAGHSLFFTGNAGTGKSFVLSDIVRVLRTRFPGRVYVTASTGIAACAIGGTTLNSFAGVGLGKEAATELVRKVKSRRESRERWRKAKVLVVDEVSMLDGMFFDKLDYVARHVRNQTALPFGGLQLVLCGDFHQLPPVGLDAGRATFCFDSAAWREAVRHEVRMTHVFRQRDPTFVRVLQEVRDGRVGPDAAAVLSALRDTQLSTGTGIEPTRLFARNHEVDAMNARRMRELRGAEYTFRAIDEGSGPQMELLRRNCTAPERLTLKVGAQVIVLKNLDQAAGIVNGTRGTVVGFGAADDPKSPGEQAGEAGGSGVGKGGGDGGARFPRVRLRLPSGEEVERQIGLEAWTIQVGDTVAAKRVQVPLKLAWALSIHKSQGMTISLLDVSLYGIFEYGQTYVALSRATSLQGLRVSGFTPDVVKTHPRVVSFMRDIRPVLGARSSILDTAPAPTANPYSASKPSKSEWTTGRAAATPAAAAPPPKRHRFQWPKLAAQAPAPDHTSAPAPAPAATRVPKPEPGTVLAPASQLPVAPKAGSWSKKGFVPPRVAKPTVVARRAPRVVKQELEGADAAYVAPPAECSRPKTVPPAGASLRTARAVHEERASLVSSHAQATGQARVGLKPVAPKDDLDAMLEMEDDFM